MNIDTLRAFSNVKTAIEYAKTQYGAYPAYPADNLRKPILPEKHDSEVIAKFHAEYMEYEEAIKKANNKQKAYRYKVNEINEVIIDFIKEESGLNTIPEQYRDKVYSKAYENGNGFYEVYIELCSLVDIFS